MTFHKHPSGAQQKKRSDLSLQLRVPTLMPDRSSWDHTTTSAQTPERTSVASSLLPSTTGSRSRLRHWTLSSASFQNYTLHHCCTVPHTDPTSSKATVKLTVMTMRCSVDDVEDSSELRRGAPVAHSIFGIAQTINTANYVYFCALAEVAKLQKPECLQIYTGKLICMRWNGRVISFC